MTPKPHSVQDDFANVHLALTTKVSAPMVATAVESLRRIEEQLEALQSGRDSWEKALGNLDAVIALVPRISTERYVTGIRDGRAALGTIEQTLCDLSERLYVAEKRGDELARLLNAAREAEPALIRVLRSSAEATEQRERALREALEYVLDALDIEHVDDAHLSNAVDKAHALLSAQATQEVR